MTFARLTFWVRGAGRSACELNAKNCMDAGPNLTGALSLLHNLKAPAFKWTVGQCYTYWPLKLAAMTFRDPARPVLVPKSGKTRQKREFRKDSLARELTTGDVCPGIEFFRDPRSSISTCVFVFTRFACWLERCSVWEKHFSRKQCLLA